MTFTEELEKTNDEAIIEIGNYLKMRADDDPLFAPNLQKENKSLQECFNYIMSEAFEKRQKEKCACITNETVFGWAVHYYDEDDIEVKPLDNVKVQAKVSKPNKQNIVVEKVVDQEAIDKAVASALDDYKKEEKEKAKKAKEEAKAKKDAEKAKKQASKENEDQLSLF